MRARPCLFGITPSQESESKYRVAANLGAINKYPLNIMYIERICICLMLLLWKISSIHADALILRLERTCEMEMEMEMEIEWRIEKKKKQQRETNKQWKVSISLCNIGFAANKLPLMFICDLVFFYSVSSFCNILSRQEEWMFVVLNYDT